MFYNYLIKHYGDIMVVELELLNENLDIERAIRDAAIKRCKMLGTRYSQEGIDYISFFKDVNEEECKIHGFTVKSIKKVSASVVDGMQKIVSSDEAQFHVAFSFGMESYHWDYVITALSLAKMCGTSKKLREIKEFQLLEWGTEFVNDNRTDLKEFFQEKINELPTVNQGDNMK